jgi:hypothetical protein
MSRWLASRSILANFSLWSSSAPGSTPSSVASIEPRIATFSKPGRLLAAAPNRASASVSAAGAIRLVKPFDHA